MGYNKKNFHKINDKKVLHKVKKQWVTISIALLGLIGGGALLTNVTANADTNNNQSNQNQDVKQKLNANLNQQNKLVNNQQQQTKQPSNNINTQTITHRANQLHDQILLGSLRHNSQRNNYSNRITSWDNRPNDIKTINRNNLKPVNSLNRIHTNQIYNFHNMKVGRLNTPFHQVKIIKQLLLHKNIEFSDDPDETLNPGDIVNVSRIYEIYGKDGNYYRYLINRHAKKYFITGHPDFNTLIQPHNYKFYQNKINNLIKHSKHTIDNDIKNEFKALAHKHNKNYHRYLSLYNSAFKSVNTPVHELKVQPASSSSDVMAQSSSSDNLPTSSSTSDVVFSSSNNMPSSTPSSYSFVQAISSTANIPVASSTSDYVSSSSVPSEESSVDSTTSVSQSTSDISFSNQPASAQSSISSNSVIPSSMGSVSSISSKASSMASHASSSSASAIPSSMSSSIVSSSTSSSNKPSMSSSIISSESQSVMPSSSASSKPSSATSSQSAKPNSQSAQTDALYSSINKECNDDMNLANQIGKTIKSDVSSYPAMLDMKNLLESAVTLNNTISKIGDLYNPIYKNHSLASVDKQNKLHLLTQTLNNLQNSINPIKSQMINHVQGEMSNEAKLTADEVLADKLQNAMNDIIKSNKSNQNVETNINKYDTKLQQDTNALIPYLNKKSFITNSDINSLTNIMTDAGKQFVDAYNNATNPKSDTTSSRPKKALLGALHTANINDSISTSTEPKRRLLGASNNNSNIISGFKWGTAKGWIDKTYDTLHFSDGTLGTPSDIQKIISYCASVDNTPQSLVFRNCVAPSNSSHLLSSCPNFINVHGLDTSHVNNMSYMFANDDNIFGLSDLNTSNVTNMSGLFENVYPTMTNTSNLVIPSTFNTSHVTNMSNMFKNASLDSITFPKNFDTSNVTDMSSMFDTTGGLTNMNELSNFDTSHVTNMSHMFCGNPLSLMVIPSTFNVSHVTNMSGIFENSGNLKNIIFPDNFDTSNVTDMSYMFSNDSALQSVAFPNSFNTSNVIDMNGLFNNDTNLQSILFGTGFSTKNVNQSDNHIQPVDVNYYSSDMFAYNNGDYQLLPKLSKITILSPNTKFRNTVLTHSYYPPVRNDKFISSDGSINDFSKGNVGTFIRPDSQYNSNNPIVQGYNNGQPESSFQQYELNRYMQQHNIQGQPSGARENNIPLNNTQGSSRAFDGATDNNINQIPQQDVETQDINDGQQRTVNKLKNEATLNVKSGEPIATKVKNSVPKVLYSGTTEAIGQDAGNDWAISNASKVPSGDIDAGVENLMSHKVAGTAGTGQTFNSMYNEYGLLQGTEHYVVHRTMGLVHHIWNKFQNSSFVQSNTP